MQQECLWVLITFIKHFEYWQCYTHMKQTALGYLQYANYRNLKYLRLKLKKLWGRVEALNPEFLLPSVGSSLLPHLFLCKRSFTIITQSSYIYLKRTAVASIWLDAGKHLRFSQLAKNIYINDYRNFCFWESPYHIKNKLYMNTLELLLFYTNPVLTDLNVSSCERWFVF